MGYVYLIHLEKPLPGNRRHYVGYARDRDHLENRWAKHRSSEGAQILKEANEAGITWMVVRVWMDVGPDKEKSVKATASKFICPVCKAKAGEIARYKKRNRQVSRAAIQQTIETEAA